MTERLQLLEINWLTVRFGDRYWGLPATVSAYGIAGLGAQVKGGTTDLRGFDEYFRRGRTWFANENYELI